MANSSYKTGTDAINNQLDQMIRLIKAVDPEGVITGEGAMTKDLIGVADVDFKNVNVWSILAVLAIIAISFKSISIPVLLVASIEAAIAINMGIPYFTGTELPFIANIVIGTIQLGATVDYSILMTTRYHEERAFGRTPKEAAQQSLEHYSQSILTSGLTFFAATVGVAAISKMELLKSICLLISRGALISMAVILVVLPAALMLCDWIIRHTTLKWMVPESANAKKSERVICHEKSLRIASAALALTLAASCAVPAFAAGSSSFSKDETVYAVMNGDGSLKEHHRQRAPVQRRRPVLRDRQVHPDRHPEHREQRRVHPERRRAGVEHR